MTGRVRIGRWDVDDHGLPVFDYATNDDKIDDAISFTTWGGSRTRLHMLGNACWNALATNYGNVCILDPRRGFTLLGGDTSERLDHGGLGLGACLIRFPDGNVLRDVESRGGTPLARLRFGPGHVKKAITCKGLQVENTLAIPPGHDPVLFSILHVKNLAPFPVSCDLLSCWDAYHYPLSKSLVVSWNKRVNYAKKPHFNRLINFAVALQRAVKADTDGARRRHARKITLSVTRVDGNIIVLQPGHKKKNKNRQDVPSDINQCYKPVFLVPVTPGEAIPVVSRAPSGAPLFDGRDRCTIGDRIENGHACMAFKITAALDANEGKNFVFMFGCEDEQRIPELVRKYTRIEDESQLLGDIASWFSRRAVTLSIPGKDWMPRELAWHSAYLLSSSFKDEWWNLQRVPQGSVYLLGHGFDGSIRDFALFSFPLTFMDPAMARESLLFLYSLVGKDGRLPYALHGFGKRLSIPFIHNNPSDQYFFVIWALTEYIYMTRDFDILNESVHIHDGREGALVSTVKERLSRLIEFVISPEIGFGSHGMVHIRDGDWNDGITLMAANRRAFVAKGESSFNTAMLAFSFDLATPLVARFNAPLAGKMRDMQRRAEAAIERAWNGRWFYRGWDGRGMPLGDETIFLDHHVWMLVNPRMAGEKMDVLVRNLERELVARSRLGASIMHPPNENNSILPPGWDINGGTWHALNALLAWGLRVRSPGGALAFIERISMHNKEVTYPGTWYGIWSGPDAYNADYSDRPGEAFYHVATPMCDFPFGNNNLHAGMVSAAIRWAGFRSGFDGITIDASLDVPFTFASALIELKVTKDAIVVVPSNAFKNDVTFVFKLPDRVLLKDVRVSPDGLEKAFKIHANSLHVMHESKRNSIPFTISWEE